MTPNYQPSTPKMNYRHSSHVWTCSCPSCLTISPLSDHFDCGLVGVPSPESATTCAVCPLTVLGERCFECRKLITIETFEFPSTPCSPRPTVLIRKPWYHASQKREASPSPTSTRWCRACAATAIGEACFVCASVVTEDTPTLHPAAFSQGATVIIGDVWYHVSRKRMTKLRRCLHTANNSDGFVEAPLPPVTMNFARTTFEDMEGIAREGEVDSLIGRAFKLLEAGLITEYDDRMLSTIRNLIVELWFHGGSVFESEIIGVSNPQRLKENDRYDWSALGLRSENHEESLLGLAKKLAAMRYLSKEDEAIIQDYCVGIAMRCADLQDDAGSDCEPVSPIVEPPEEYDSEYESVGEADSEDETRTEDIIVSFRQPRLQTPEPFAWQSEPIDALFDARTKLAHIHILAADDEPKSIYHLNPEMVAQIDFLTNMPSPQRPDNSDISVTEPMADFTPTIEMVKENEGRGDSEYQLAEAIWERLNSAFDREHGLYSFGPEHDGDDEIDSDFEDDEDGESESDSLGIHIVDTMYDLPSLANFPPLSSTSSANQAASPMFSTSSPAYQPISPISPKSPMFSATSSMFPTSQEHHPVSPKLSNSLSFEPTARERLERALSDIGITLQGEPSSAQISSKGVECRMINKYGEAFEWGILL